MLSIRQRTIIQYILGHPEGISGNQLSEALRVSPKTIRNDIAAMNRMFLEQGFSISAARKNGYFIKEESRDELMLTLDMKSFPWDIKEAETPQERRMAVLDCVLGCPGVSIDAIAESVCVSEPTVYKDFVQLRQELEKYYGFSGLCVKNHCACIEASESEIRHLIFRMITSFVMKSGQLMDSNLYQLMRGIVNLNEIDIFYEYTVMYCRERQFMLSEQLLYLTAWMVFYTNVRREEAFFLEPADTFSRQDELAGFLDFMNQTLFLEFEDCDFEFLYRSLEALGFPGGSCESAEEDEVKPLVDEFIQKLAEQYYISFDETSVKQDFLKDMICLRKRIKNNSQFQDFPESSAERMFGLSCQAAMMMAGRISREYNVRLTAAEIRRITGYAESCKEKTHSKVRAQLICCLDGGRLYQVRHWIEKTAGSWVTLSEPCPRYLLEEACRKNKPDLLIAAEAADIKGTLPELILSGPLTVAEERRLKLFLENVFLKKQLSYFFEKILTREKVLFFDERISAEEAVLACSRILKDSGCVEDGEAFAREVMTRDCMYPAARENGCCFLQSYERSAVSDGVCMGICRYPGNEFAVIFTGAFSAHSEIDFDTISSTFQNLFKKHEIVSLLREAEDETAALKILAERIYQLSIYNFSGGKKDESFSCL